MPVGAGGDSTPGHKVLAFTIPKRIKLLDVAFYIGGVITGLLTSILIFFLFFLFIGYKIGFSNLFTKLKNQIIPSESSARVLVLPQDILKELIQLKAPIGNAKNPTKVPKHDTLLVRPDKKLGYILRPNVRISVSMLKSTKAINIDPPVLHLKYDDNLEYSNQLKIYLKE